MICRRVLFPSNVQSESDNLAVVWLRLNWIWNSWRPGKDCNEFIVVYLRRFVERKKILWGFVLSKILTKWLRFKQTKTQKKQKIALEHVIAWPHILIADIHPGQRTRTLFACTASTGHTCQEEVPVWNVQVTTGLGSQSMHMINYVRQLHGLWWLLIEQFPALYPVRRFDPGRFSHKWTRTVMERSTAESLYLGSEWTMMDHDIQTGLAAGLTGYSFRCLQITSKLTWICTTYPSLCRLRLWSIYLSISYHAKFAPTHAIQKNFKNNYIYIGIWIYMYTDLYPNLSDLIPLFIIVQYMFNTWSHAIDWRRCRTS